MTEPTTVTKPKPQTAQLYQTIQHVNQYLNQRIIGQEGLITRMLIALLCDGHLLVEGAPGLAKTKAIKELAACIEGDFHRIQFTPDLLPADLTGTEIYRPQDGSFHFQQGPIFHNLILADEINRAPAKVQSALLEAMAEKQVTIGRETYTLPTLFLVMATQNPLEQEGTYPLPEAQLDRFLLHVKVNYPNSSTEKRILQLVREEAHANQPVLNRPTLSQASIFGMRQAVLNIHLSPALEEYIIQLVVATRQPAQYDQPNSNQTRFSEWLRFGASPRASISLDRCARAHAWLNGRDFVSPEDIHAIAPDVLRHRILLSFVAEAENIDPDAIIQHLLQHVPVP
ncbi:MAG: MoxR family ATPase [Gammaproteobacteria bacterium]